MTEAAAWRVVARGIVLFFGIVLVTILLRELRSVIVQLLLALLLAAAASPLVDALTTPDQAPGRGEAVLGAIIGGLTWTGTLLLGLPYAAVLALIAAIPLIAIALLSSPTQAARAWVSGADPAARA